MSDQTQTLAERLARELITHWKVVLFQDRSRRIKLAMHQRRLTEDSPVVAAAPILWEFMGEVAQERVQHLTPAERAVLIESGLGHPPPNGQTSLFKVHGNDWLNCCCYWNGRDLGVRIAATVIVAKMWDILRASFVPTGA